jgi:hypothetical protein
MSAKRSTQCIILLSLLGVAGVDVRAQPMLLVEIHKHGFNRVNAIGDPVRLEFITEMSDSGPRTVFGGDYSTSDSDMTFDAPVDLVARFEAALKAPTGMFALIDGGHTPVGTSADSIWNMPFGTYTTTVHAPRLGHGLTGYNLARVAHTVSIGYIITPGPSGGPTAEIRQTIALWGEPVPEPGTVALLVVAHLMLLSRRFAFHRALKLAL